MCLACAIAEGSYKIDEKKIDYTPKDCYNCSTSSNY